MKILILGAGAIGGFLGGHLLASGADVTFLVRPRRAAELAARGLVIADSGTDLRLANVKTVGAEDLRADYDLVVLSCKAYDLAAAIDAVRPAMAGGRAHLLPLLNGMRHMDDLDAAFGASRILGGSAHISVTLDGDGTVHLLRPLQRFTYGPRTPEQDAVCEAARPILTRSATDVRLSPTIMADMWEKWVLLATLAGMTCLMRASIGDIVATTDGRAMILSTIGECQRVAWASQQYPREAHLKATRELLTEPGSTLTASMLRDLEQGRRTEAEHIIGDLCVRAERAGVGVPLLRAAYCHLQAYETGRARAQAAGAA